MIIEIIIVLAALVVTVGFLITMLPPVAKVAVIGVIIFGLVAFAIASVVMYFYKKRTKEIEQPFDDMEYEK